MATQQDDITALGKPDSSSGVESIRKDGGFVTVKDTPVVQTETRTTGWRRILSFVWDSVDGDPEYRKYVRRLDLFFL